RRVHQLPEKETGACRIADSDGARRRLHDLGGGGCRGGDARDTAGTDLDLFAAAVAHEIRTPLTPGAGGIEVAARRDRSAEEYREVLRRIAAPVSELVAISGDLSLLSGPARRAGRPAASARLDMILARITSRYHENHA